MPSLTACRCRLHIGIEKCENPGVPCGAGLLHGVLGQSRGGEADETDKKPPVLYSGLELKSLLQMHVKLVLMKP